jgi:hypothetical protein
MSAEDAEPAERRGAHALSARLRSRIASWLAACVLAGVVAIADAVVLAVEPLTASAAQIDGPASVRLGSEVTFTASGVPAGTYTMRLVYVAIPAHGVSGTNCVAEIGKKTKATAGHVRIAGKLPARLACSSGAGPVEGSYTVKPGRYTLTINRDERGTPFGGDPFLKHPLRLTA